jgi:hypothetical protein
VELVVKSEEFLRLPVGITGQDGAPEKFDSGHPDVLLITQPQIKICQTYQYLLNMLGYMFRPL